MHHCRATAEAAEGAHVLAQERLIVLLADLVLQHQEVTCCCRSQHNLQLIARDLTIGAAKQDDAVLTLCIDFDTGVASRMVADFELRCMA